ncbi:unnamed protein product [Owenia fusiformis]|uniref:Uncharacterized protein n=1 Tax=Owenia fusiformis TaxID=6347 RepID=A0A8S4PGK1_OWEFU|nr:unnamed protein product [Owenia fusiformis]
MRSLILLVLAVGICKVSGKSISCKCAVSDRCSLDEDAAYGCQSDDESADLECDCSTCTCSKGIEEYLYQSSIESKLPFSESEKAAIMGAIGAVKELVDDLNDLLGGIAELLKRAADLIKAFYEWLKDNIIRVCTMLRNKIEGVQKMIDATVEMLKKVRNFRDSKSNWLEDVLKIIEDKINELRKMEFQSKRLMLRKIETGTLSQLSLLL